MKRLLPLLILAAFLFGITGGKVSRLPALLQVRASAPDSPQFSVNRSDEEPSSKLEVDGESLPAPCEHVSFLEPSRKSLPPLSNCFPASPKDYLWLGLGCGGLPS